MFGVLIVSLLLFCPKVSAEGPTVLVQAPGSLRLDYRATLKAHADFVSPTEDYLNRHPLTSARETLLSVFAEAQHAFLDRSPAEAQAKFREVLAQLLNEDWSGSDREIFLHAYLRLAQIEDNESRRTEILRQSLVLGDDVNYDSSLFPPPLIERRADLRRRMKAVDLDLRALSGDFHKILINGRSCEGFRCVALAEPSEKVRVTYLSDLHPPHTEILALKEIHHVRPKLEAWVHGQCQSPEWGAAAEVFTKRKAFWSLDCDKPNPVAQNLKVIPVFQEFKAASAFDVATSSPAEAPPMAFYKNKWVWIGVGVGAAVVAAVIWSQNNAHQSASATTTTYGY